MKKALVLFLILATLAPMVLAQPAGAAIEEEPFYALSWSDFDETKYPYLDGLLSTGFSNFGEDAILSLGDAKMQYGSYTDADVTKLANAMKEKLEARPAGKRYWNLQGPLKILSLAPDDVLFLEQGVEQMQDLTSALLKKMAEIGCPLDGVVIDTEVFALDAWHLWTNSGNSSFDWYYNNNKNLYAQIVKNPKYKKLIRPLLEEYGFPFYPNPSGYKSEIFYLCYESDIKENPKHNQAVSIWNTVMRIHLNKYANQWLYEPLKKYFPEASCSDYQSHDSKSWYKISGVGDDGVALSGGNSIRVGTASTFSYYYSQPSASDYAANKQFASYNDGVYEQSSFNSLLYEVNFTRHMYASTDTGQIAPWITSYLWTRDPQCQWGRTAYYTELLYHLGMFDPEPFLSFTFTGDLDGEGEWEKTGQTMNAVMAALTEVAGYADRKPIEMPQYWNAEYIVSGMYCGGRNLWRITPNTDEVSLSAFKTSAKDPTFSVKGQTITFPGGKILKDATIPNVGSTGYWVETKAGVNPVMTADANRYAKYPSFEESFDSYENGKLTTSKMAQTYAWAIRTQKGDTAEVVTSGEGKALALTGNANFENISIPAKITAGDSYAKHQTWEITVTVPSGLSADAEIHLLPYESKDGDIDGGIKLQGGKAYYGELVDSDVEYRELAEVKPGTYTIKRVMNFSDPDNFTYDIHLLDSKGTEITNAKHISCPAFTAIHSISFFTKNADKAVLVDDYKLYPSGLATDFELYDAAVGRNLVGEEADEARSRSTAYRLSWLNGTNATKTATVIAAIYENGSLKSEKAVKTITMKPGHDGVETGIVEVKAGQSVKVYLKGGVQQDATPNQPDANENENKTQPTEEQEGGASATKATASASKATKASRVTKATKVPTRASRATKATQPTKATGDAPATELSELTEATQITAATESTEATGFTDATEATGDADAKDKTSPKTVGLIVAISVVVLAAGAGLATWLVLKKKKPVAAPEATEAAETNEEPEKTEE